MAPTTVSDNQVSNKPPDDWWVCACVKGGSVKHRRPSTHMKFHPPETTECRVCGCTKAQHDAIAADIDAEGR